MRLLLIPAFGLGLLAASSQAQAIGCVSGAVAGGAAGHMVHHTVIGMVGGCIAGHEAHKALKRRAMERRHGEDRPVTH
jgi:outer membrane lipoprotein SlyB